ncbi:tripartite tricarboxylate transporter substrate binding protein [Bradyrhizobium diazoefficiens]|nr:tripartite tricarboxylate transporter substrate binding protein [Bradyrhizobium diazoefficiens]UCF53106.1 MAG: tripartite tricarboxylate transporter substrate binding protein [Bradyrhizobium sp.]MBR0965269.1 tripartite tricarboxylate transporter substrate binding protein [Bradyrhizobium diazoefficiens]MBR0977666.1 tripartite tricarboxylate transporter substrate binding protein [Bradyrhizobium diazoefficiens]MBR1007652.1 tripartite tricarboxylate transporter substrate binding protein [Bradyrh
MMNRRHFLGSAACAAAVLATPRAFATGNPSYPSRSVKWVVPYAAGGATDVLSRLLCQRLSERLGQSFVVENKPGAGSNIGTQAVIASPPDGYTLLLTSTANAINASFDPALPYDFAKGIAPVAGIARIPLVLVVSNDLPVKTVADFIAYAKSNPGKMSIASSGIGTSLHLSGELFKSMAGVQFTHVPYRGSAPGLTDVISGQIQGMFDNVTSSFELVRAGKLRALGVTTRERSEILPDVPPIAETLPGYETSSFYGVGAPHETPREIVDLLNREIDTALSDAEIKARVAELGAIPLHGTAGEFGAMLAAETDRWRKVVELSGAKKE